MIPRPFLVAFAVAMLSAPSVAAEPWDKPGYLLTFHDEFDGAGLDLSAWGLRYKWGEAVINEELQAYVDDALVVDSGLLHITASHEPGSYAGETMDYRSGLIASVHEQTYGYFEIRCRMPAGQGYWPAFWLLGALGTTGVNEIDIHEFLGHDVDTIYATVHWGTDYGEGHESDGSSFTGPDFSADFHTIALEWEPSSLTWFVDGAPIFVHDGEGVPSVPMYLIANLAVGGTWPGAPDGTTIFPGRYDIDYIRAYQRDLDAGVGGGGQAGGAPTGGSTPTGGGGSGPLGGSGGAGPAASTAPSPNEPDAGACGCRTVSAGSAGTIGWWLALGLVGARRRSGGRAVRSTSSAAGKAR